MRKALAINLLALLFFAATASALSPGQVSVALSPNKVKASSKLSVVAQGPFPSVSGLPSSIALFAQRGFKSDPRSVAAKCAATQGSTPCPPASKVGTGSATANVVTNVGLGSGSYTVPFALFLGPAQQSGDVASVVLQGSVTVPVLGTQQLTATGRLIKIPHGTYGLELLFANFPTIQLPAGITATITLTQLNLSASASRVVRITKTVTVKVHGKKKKKKKKVKVRYSLITNPPTCGKTKTWGAKIVVNFQNGGNLTQTVAAPCRTH